MSFFKWEPTTNSLTEITLYKRTMLRRLAKKISDEGIMPESLDFINQQAKAAKHSTYFHPALAAYVMNELSEASQDKSIMERNLRALIESIGSERSFTFIPSAKKDPIQLDSWDWAAAAVRQQGRELTRDLGYDPSLVIGNDLGGRGEELFREALELLNDLWPEASALTRSVVTYFVWFSSPKYWSSTQGQSFGAVYVGPRENWTMPFFFETLLHEGGHLHLMVKEAISPLLENPTDKIKSPLRTDMRPVRGVFHANFVLTRMAEGMGRLARAEGPHSKEAAAMAKLNIERLGSGLDSISGAARFTPAGQELHDSITQHYESLKKSLL